MSRRSRPESLAISMRAVSGCVRMSEVIEVSVLKRKCGLIWLASASIFAARSSFSCSCSRCSMRALFQILIGIATQRTVREQDDGPGPPRGLGLEVERGRCNRAPRPCRRSSSAIGASSSRTCQSTLDAAHHLPRAAMKAGEDERREVPDRLLRAQLAQAAARETASDRERQRDELAVRRAAGARPSPRRWRRRTARQSGRPGTRLPA